MMTSLEKITYLISYINTMNTRILFLEAGLNDINNFPEAEYRQSAERDLSDLISIKEAFEQEVINLTK